MHRHDVPIHPQRHTVCLKVDVQLNLAPFGGLYFPVWHRSSKDLMVKVVFDELFGVCFVDGVSSEAKTQSLAIELL